MRKGRACTYAWDRRKAAIHEAGHIVVSEHVGCPIFGAWIEPIIPLGKLFTTRSSSFQEKTWVGHARLDRSGVNDFHRCQIGVAGAVAELAWDREPIDPDYWTEPAIMSEADWQLVGCRSGEPDATLCEAIEQVGEWLRPAAPLWYPLILTARALIIESRERIEAVCFPSARQTP